MTKKILIVIGLILTSVVLYYIVVIIIARADTPDIVHRALTSDRIKLDLVDLSDEQIKALLKIEDPNFYNHQGFDFSTPGAGVTTISQGLVKMYYFDNFKPGIQKIKQTLISRFAFDNLTQKDTILKLLINDVYVGHVEGHAIKGFENAANSYFRKSFKDLTWDEYLSIIAMLVAPMNYNYAENREANQDRVAKIKRVLTGEYIPVDNSDLLYDRRLHAR